MHKLKIVRVNLPKSPLCYLSGLQLEIQTFQCNIEVGYKSGNENYSWALVTDVSVLFQKKEIPPSLCAKFFALLT